MFTQSTLCHIDPKHPINGNQCLFGDIKELTESWEFFPIVNLTSFAILLENIYQNCIGNQFENQP
jgi:hypothetical protein